jgi:hypothetical protein
MTKSRRIRWAGLAVCMEEISNSYKILTEKPERKIPLGRRRRRWEYNIKMDLKEIGWRVWTGCIWLRIGTDGGLL